MQINCAELEAKIKRRVELGETGRLLEWALHHEQQLDTRGEYLYLYGLVLFKGKNFQKSLEMMEEACKTGYQDVRALFLLAKLYMRNGDHIKAIEAFKQSLVENYRVKYCQRSLVKLSYQMNDYVAVNNYAIEFLDCLNDYSLSKIFRIEALAKMQLYHEAYRLYRELTRLKGSWEKRLQRLLVQNQTIYETCYELNREFFCLHHLSLEPYRQLQYKISNYQGQQLVYDCESQTFVASITEEKNEEVELNLTEGDTLLIYNSEDLEVFEYLAGCLTDEQSKIYQQRMAALPIFIYEKKRQNWQLLMQLFDFRVLHKWNNLHLIMGATTEDLGTILLDVKAPLPNILYGTELVEARELLIEIGNAREEFFKQKFEAVSNYYQYYHQNQMQKILIVTSIYSELLYHYAKMLQQHLERLGYNCKLECESAPYYKFTRNQQLKLLEEFAPDLVVHFLGSQEELELFKRLNLPFVSWFLFNKQLSQINNTNSQKIYYTGNISDDEKSSLQTLPLPVPDLSKLETKLPPITGEIGVVADLESLASIKRSILNQLLAYQVFTSQPLEMSLQILEMIYGEVADCLLRGDLRPLEIEFYQDLILRHFDQYQLCITQQGSSMMAEIIKQELEQYCFKKLQVKWLLEAGYQVQLYGTGWHDEESFRAAVHDQVNYLKDLSGYRKVILENQIQLYLDSRVQNNSLLQPDLINGIALGGFYLISPVLINNLGEQALASFDYQLESYTDKKDFLAKVAFYLKHPRIRKLKAKALQEYVVQHFQLEKIAKKLIRGARNLNAEKVN